MQPFLRPALWAVPLLAVATGLAQDQPAVTAIVAGTVHPVDGPAIDGGVLLIRGDKIAAVGRKGDVEIPAGAVVLDYPQAHVYPGLVDALSDAFTDNTVRGDGSLDAATELDTALRPRGDSQDLLVQAGITTAYIGAGANTTWRGLGAVVRPQREGFARWPEHRLAGLQVRLGTGAQPSHPLQRQQQIDGVGKAFEGLEAYEKALREFDEAVAKYDKEFAAWLEQQKKQSGEPADGGRRDGSGGRREGQAGEGGRRQGPPAGEGGEGRRGRGRRGGQPPAGETPPPAPQQPAPQPPAAQQPPAAAPAAGSGEAAAKRPQYPKRPPRDPVKDALLLVREGLLPLRAEAQRPDEIRGALAMAKDKKLPALVLEQCCGAGDVAAAIAEAGVACVLTDVAPGALPAVEEFERCDMLALPAVLQRAGVAFAIASGSAARADGLRLMAASAIGNGLPAEAALRALTLAPAQILGVQQQVGSLTPGKLADVLVVDRPLFASDSRVLRVLSAGQTQYEAK